MANKRSGMNRDMVQDATPDHNLQTGLLHDAAAIAFYLLVIAANGIGLCVRAVWGALCVGRHDAKPVLCVSFFIHFLSGGN